MFFGVLASEVMKSPAGHGGGLGGTCPQCNFLAFNVVTFLFRCPKRERVVLVYYQDLGALF